ncbi:DUF302 domain-containing protein [Stappia sp. MMSF_3263]|uniref:DUF302 domain-containing protein n=1 Tax=Stappia sp. MMSF_3263 TaxID=3046693 RepID=UPI00273E3EDA|nr:DUF302 domain-containing protein [Stappia sp. MMSF_3263]
MRPALAFPALLAVLAFLLLPAKAEIAPRPGWVVIETGHGFAELVERVKRSVAVEKMGLVTQASASDGAAMQGIAIPGNRVLGVYRNDYARRMLEANIAAGIEAPIRFYVTENGDGSATLSWKTPGHVFAPYMDEGGTALSELAAELDAVFARIGERAVRAE